MFKFSGTTDTYESEEGLLPSDSEDQDYDPVEEKSETESEIDPFGDEMEKLFTDHLDERAIFRNQVYIGPEYIEKLQLFAQKETQVNRIKWFNSVWGTVLRMINSNHSVQRKKPRPCALCGIHNAIKNEAGKSKLRPRSRACCKTCNVHLCMIPQKGHNHISCWEHWHTKPTLVARNYFALENPEDTE